MRCGGQVAGLMEVARMGHASIQLYMRMRLHNIRMEALLFANEWMDGGCLRDEWRAIASHNIGAP